MSSSHRVAFLKIVIIATCLKSKPNVICVRGKDRFRLIELEIEYKLFWF